MTGVAVAGATLDGWDHVQQSIRRILTTPYGSRVMRRDFGSDLENLIDAPMNARNVMAMFAATAIALEPRLVDGNWYGEPRFRLEQVRVTDVGADGRIALDCAGTYYPNGHKGDFSRAVSVVTDVILGLL